MYERLRETSSSMSRSIRSKHRNGEFSVHASSQSINQYLKPDFKKKQKIPLLKEPHQTGFSFIPTLDYNDPFSAPPNPFKEFSKHLIEEKFQTRKHSKLPKLSKFPQRTVSLGSHVPEPSASNELLPSRSEPPLRVLEQQLRDEHDEISSESSDSDEFPQAEATAICSSMAGILSEDCQDVTVYAKARRVCEGKQLIGTSESLECISGINLYNSQASIGEQIATRSNLQNDVTKSVHSLESALYTATTGETTEEDEQVCSDDPQCVREDPETDPIPNRESNNDVSANDGLVSSMIDLDPERLTIDFHPSNEHSNNSSNPILFLDGSNYQENRPDEHTRYEDSAVSQSHSRYGDSAVSQSHGLEGLEGLEATVMIQMSDTGGPLYYQEEERQDRSRSGRVDHNIPTTEEQSNNLITVNSNNYGELLIENTSQLFNCPKEDRPSDGDSDEDDRMNHQLFETTMATLTTALEQENRYDLDSASRSQPSTDALNCESFGEYGREKCNYWDNNNRNNDNWDSNNCNPVDVPVNQLSTDWR